MIFVLALHYIVFCDQLQIQSYLIILFFSLGYKVQQLTIFNNKDIVRCMILLLIT